MATLERNVVVGRGRRGTEEDNGPSPPLTLIPPLPPTVSHQETFSSCQSQRSEKFVAPFRGKKQLFYHSQQIRI